MSKFVLLVIITVIGKNVGKIVYSLIWLTTTYDLNGSYKIVLHPISNKVLMI